MDKVVGKDTEVGTGMGVERGKVVLVLYTAFSVVESRM